MQKVAARPTTQFSGHFSIFEALYELENFGKFQEEPDVAATENKSTNAGSSTEFLD